MKLSRIGTVLSDNGSCPYCGSHWTQSKGISSKNGLKRRKMQCQECLRNFTSNFTVDHDPLGNSITFSLNRYVLKFGISAQAALEMEGRDIFELDFDRGYFTFKKSSSGLMMNKKEPYRNTVSITSKLITSVLRDEFNIEDNNPAIFEIDIKTNNIVGLIKKANIRQKTAKERIAFNAEGFISLKADGTTYISAKLAYEMDLQKGDYLCLFEEGDNLYIFKAKTEEEIENGYRISSTAAAGFKRGLLITSAYLTSYLCANFDLETGGMTQRIITVYEKVKGREMARLINPQ